MRPTLLLVVIIVIATCSCLQSKLQGTGNSQLYNPKREQHGRGERALTSESHSSLLLAADPGASYFNHENLNIFICEVKLIACLLKSLNK